MHDYEAYPQRVRLSPSLILFTFPMHRPYPNSRALTPVYQLRTLRDICIGEYI